MNKRTTSVVLLVAIFLISILSGCTNSKFNQGLVTEKEILIDLYLQDCLTQQQLTVKPSISNGLDGNGTKILKEDLKTISNSPHNNSISFEVGLKNPCERSDLELFTGYGGEIKYMYKATGYGWNGKMPADNILEYSEKSTSLNFIHIPRAMVLH